MSLDPYSLWASMIWASVGIGYVMYGKKQGRLVPVFGGIAIVAVSYIAGTAVMISLVSVALMVAIYVLARRYD